MGLLTGLGLRYKIIQNEMINVAGGDVTKSITTSKSSFSVHISGFQSSIRPFYLSLIFSRGSHDKINRYIKKKTSR